MTLCSDIHHSALQHGGGTVTFTCPETGAIFVGYAGTGGTFVPTQITPAATGKLPMLVVAVGQAPFAGAKAR
ncbi:MAG: hypothetical protein RLZZ70_216 [Candidatus Parcubacteria bacterium]|jgi:hypothetical protein